MRTHITSRTESKLPAISNCWKRKDCEGPAQELSLERVAPRLERKAAPSSKPLFGGDPFGGFQDAFQPISF